MSDGTQFGDVPLSVGDFVALVNQTFEYAYPTVSIRGELANFKVSKNKWVYFDLKDGEASVRFFGTVYQLPGPLEDGMVVIVKGTPHLHARFGFNVSILSIRPSGEGTIRRSAEMLQASLAKEGLFDEMRKRHLLYPPSRVGLITSTESAAYADFIKILNARWQGIDIECIDVQVQGEGAPLQIVGAIEAFNRQAEPPDVLVLIRGGGSTEDLYAFSTESVTRAVAASRVPTLVAIGHEVDTCLAELAADQRASTPSNAAELLVPDRREIRRELRSLSFQLHDAAERIVQESWKEVSEYRMHMERSLSECIVYAVGEVESARRLLAALDPRAIIRRGYAIVRNSKNEVVRHAGDVRPGDALSIEVDDGYISAVIK
jgi:exodeoxyribonuclease VII large subunit